MICCWISNEFLAFSNSFPNAVFSNLNRSFSFNNISGFFSFNNSGSMKLILAQFNSSFCRLYIDNKFVKSLFISPYWLYLFNLSWNNLSLFSRSILVIFNFKDSSLYFSLSIFSKFKLRLSSSFSLSSEPNFNSASFNFFSFSSKFFLVSVNFFWVICKLRYTLPLSSACLIKGLILKSLSSSCNMASFIL